MYIHIYIYKSELYKMKTTSKFVYTFKHPEIQVYVSYTFIQLVPGAAILICIP